jgi:putative membrane protein
MKKFNDEGIDKIDSVVNKDLKDMIETLKAMRDASREYNSYSGISDDMDGSVKFIYVVDGTK